MRQRLANAEAPAGLRPFLNLLQLNDPGLRALLQDWLHNVFVADDVNAAFAERAKLPAGGCFVTRQGHVISQSSVRFYASDSEQDGMLARQQEIENLDKQLRAQKMLADEARSRSVRAEAALTQATQRLQELRQRANGLTQAVHALQIEVMKLTEVQERFNQRSTQIEVDLAEIAAAGKRAAAGARRSRKRSSSSSTWNWPNCSNATRTARPIIWRRNSS